ISPRSYLIDYTNHLFRRTLSTVRRTIENIPVKAFRPSITYKIIYFIYLRESDYVLPSTSSTLATSEPLKKSILEYSGLSNIRISGRIHKIYRIEDECYIAYKHMPQSLEEENRIIVNSLKNVRDLDHVMMELIKGYAKEGTSIRLDNPDR
ncbi:hypothetical protein TOPH_09218, partial [Tolypocladium ophioglossoides CBS 100239]